MAGDNAGGMNARECQSRQPFSGTPRLAPERQEVTYSPYGYCDREVGVSCVLGFNGERQEPVTGGYLLGNGYRNFYPTLMRFSSPDNLSPFGRGGINAYCYCAGDPVNRQDPSGHQGWPVFPRNFRKARYFRIVKGLLYEAGRSRVRRASMPALLDRPSGDEIVKEWDMVGLHASASENLKSLQANLDPIFQGTPGREFLGPGFYAAPEIDVPTKVAGIIQLYDNKEAMIFSVYTKSMARLKLGRDSDFSQVLDMPTQRNQMEIVFRTETYYLMAVQQVRSGRIVLPRSKEAPF